MNKTIETTKLQEFKLELGFKFIYEVMEELGMEKIISKDKKLMVCIFG